MMNLIDFIQTSKSTKKEMKLNLLGQFEKRQKLKYHKGDQRCNLNTSNIVETENRHATV